MFVEVTFTLLAFSGLVIYYWTDIKDGISEVRRKVQNYLYGFKVQYEHGEKKTRESKGAIEAMRKLLQATFGLGAKKSTYVFSVGSFLLAMGTFFLLRGRIDNTYVFIATIFVMSLPTLLLLARLQTIRIKNSREGGILVSELCDNYKINYFNMHQAIEITALNIKEAPNSKRLLFNLAKSLNTASQPEDIKSILEDFSFSLGTSWGTILADNMYFALVSGIRVTEALEDLVDTLAKARKIEEYSRRENNEGGLILKYLVPCCYALTFLGGTKYFGLTVEEFIKYQFFTGAGLSWFVVSVMIYIVGILLRMFLARSKLDL